MPEKRRRTMASDPQSSPTRPVQQNHAASNAFGDLISPKTPSAVSSRIMQASKDISVWKAQDNSNYVLLSAALRSALKERCKLALHIIPGEAQYYSIVVGKQGAKLNASVLGAETQTPSVELPFGGLMTITHHDGIQVRTFHAATMKSLAAALTMNSPSRPVQDKTGLTGRYDFSLQQRSSADQTDQMDDPGAALNRWPIGHLGLALKLV